MPKSTVYVAFYCYCEPVTDFASLKRRIIHELTCRLTKSRYSHCEIARRDTARGAGKSSRVFICDSASGRDGGIRRKQMRLTPNHWDLIKVADASMTRIDDLYRRNVGKKYDYLGALRAICPFIHQSPQRWYCSEYVAAALALPADSGLTPQTLYSYLTTEYNHV